jgi:hypothetical protein
MAHGKPADLSKFEKLGAFYLGRRFDAPSNSVVPEPLLYDAKDLTTHAVCVGMTGSGKTGLCLSLLEEAAIDGIPAIAIDPKGDLGNLLLTFPALQAADFRPWIDHAEASRSGVSGDQYAEGVAQRWREGLAAWGQDGTRIQRLRDAADVAIYTPGSTAGLPLTVMKSFSAPPPDLLHDTEAFNERVAASVSGLLGLIGIDADPIQSREHILLSHIFKGAWEQERDLDVAALIAEVQKPPFERIGVMEVETVFPSADRFGLAMRLNNLLASPSFAAWMEGEPLNISRLLWTAEGKPRIAIVSIAHLSEQERMFFVTLLLNETIAWMRRQAGTASLRAILYMDEVFGFFPPSANPPSKRPMLTLLKQARAYGLGVVLATQNPVDLDYKGLSNAGTWFLGRLQTERDKMRVMEGLEGASAAGGVPFDRPRMEQLLAGLQSRVFLMNNVHDDEPVLFHTRWALSYLRGPLTRAQIQTAMADRKDTVAPSTTPPRPTLTSTTARATRTTKAAGRRPAVPAEIVESFLPHTASGESGELMYRPTLLGTADLHYANARADVDVWESAVYLAPLDKKSGTQVWSNAQSLPDGQPELHDQPDANATFAPLPAKATKARSYATWEKSFKTFLYKERPLILVKCPSLKLLSELGESPVEFKIRVREAAREERDRQVEKLRKRYASKLATLQDRIRRAEEKVRRETSQYENQRMQTAISVGATVLGALFGRKVASVGTVGRATTSVRGVGRAAREKDDIARAKNRLEELHEQLGALEDEFEREAESLDVLANPESLELKEVVVRPRKADIAVGRVALVWTP